MEVFAERRRLPWLQTGCDRRGGTALCAVLPSPAEWSQNTQSESTRYVVGRWEMRWAEKKWFRPVRTVNALAKPEARLRPSHAPVAQVVSRLSSETRYHFLSLTPFFTML